jgi:hypothetical protein
MPTGLSAFRALSRVGFFLFAERPRLWPEPGDFEFGDREKSDFGDGLFRFSAAKVGWSSNPPLFPGKVDRWLV